MAATYPAAASESRNRRLVEAALLADITVVLLLGRVYLPIPVVRTLWRLLAAAPFVLLGQRWGVRMCVMAGITAYLLLTTLIGPTLALPALDTAFAAVIIVTTKKWRWPLAAGAIVGGIVYTALDIVLPTILFAVVLRIPVSTFIHDIHAAMQGSVHILAATAEIVNHILRSLLGSTAPRIPIHNLQTMGYSLTAFVIANWVPFALIVASATGIANVFGYQAASELVLERLPAHLRTSQAPD